MFPFKITKKTSNKNNNRIENKKKQNRIERFFFILLFNTLCFVFVCFYLFHFICSMSKIKTIIIIIIIILHCSVDQLLPPFSLSFFLSQILIFYFFFIQSCHFFRLSIHNFRPFVRCKHHPIRLFGSSVITHIIYHPVCVCVSVYMDSEILYETQVKNLKLSFMNENKKILLFQQFYDYHHHHHHQ